MTFLSPGIATRPEGLVGRCLSFRFLLLLVCVKKSDSFPDRSYTEPGEGLTVSISRPLCIPSVLIPSANVLSLSLLIPSGNGRGRLAVPPVIENRKSANVNSPLPSAVL